MNNLDEDYLNLVRETIYNKNSKKSAKIKSRNPVKVASALEETDLRSKNTVPQRFKTKKDTFKAKNKLKNQTKNPKQRQVSFNESPEDTTPASEMKSKITDRVCTPFKANKTKNPAFNIYISKKLSPTLKENGIHKISSANYGNTDAHTESSNQESSEPRKRKLSFSNGTNSNLKKKKEKPLNDIGESKKGTKKSHIKDDFLVKKTHSLWTKSPNQSLSELSETPLNTTWENFLGGLKLKPKIKKTKKVKLKTSKVLTRKPARKLTKVLLSDNSSSSDSSDSREIVKSNHQEENVEDSHLLDRNDVGVKGLNFEKFCNQFVPTLSTQFFGTCSTLAIPEKHLKTVPEDMVTTSEEEINVRRSNLEINNLNNQEINRQLQHPKSKDHDESFEDMICENSQIASPKKSYSSPKKVNKKSLNELSSNNTARHLQDTKRPVILDLKDASKVVILEVGDQFYFYGLCLIKVLHGDIEILGATLNKQSGDKKVYSPRGSALLYIKNNHHLYLETTINLQSLIGEYLIPKEKIQSTYGEHCAIVQIKELREPYIEFIEKYISQKIFPEVSFGPRVDFELNGSWNRIKKTEIWEEILDRVNKNSITVVSGGKGVGKSTFLRYAINYLLGKYDKISIIDLDPGQSEFCVPGCVSLITLDDTILGPNYTHLIKPDRLILSHINMGHDIKRYLSSVECLLDSLEPSETHPTLVNFPGYTQGLGLDISFEIIKMLQPKMVIQINSKQTIKNYKLDLSPENVLNYQTDCGFSCPERHLVGGSLSYELVKIDSMAERSEAWSMESRQCREIVIFSYLGKMMNETERILTNLDANMYSIKLSTLTVTNVEGKHISPLAINASLVGLCSVSPGREDIFNCHGYGFVRGVDQHEDILVLVTPEPIEALDQTTHLILTSVSTPPSLLMTVDDPKDYVPYVNVGELVDFGQFTKRSYLPPRRSDTFKNV